VPAAEGLAAVPIDVTDAASIGRARDTILSSHPGLDTVVTMSGVGIPEDLRDPAHFSAARETIDTNLLGTIRVIDAFTPHLIGRGAGTIITVSSGIGFLPFPVMPTYAASKAAVHAYSEALRAQLDGTGVEVCELVPPAVATRPEAKQLNPRALDLADFATEVMDLLQASPTPHEILVKGVLMHRWAERDGTNLHRVPGAASPGGGACGIRRDDQPGQPVPPERPGEPACPESGLVQVECLYQLRRMR
jgi:short-subunit dehydrogenase involved in D-alanine esterification of teichoic acids